MATCVPLSNIIMLRLSQSRTPIQQIWGNKDDRNNLSSKLLRYFFRFRTRPRGPENGTKSAKTNALYDKGRQAQMKLNRHVPSDIKWRWVPLEHNQY